MEFGGDNQSQSSSWCDEKGFGPFIEGTNTLTMCFCATVFELPPPIILAIFGIPSLVRLSKEPFVNPASSWTFSLKLGLSAVNLFCSMLLAMFGQPASLANTWSQCFAAAGWLLSILILVTGYLRAQPQLLLLRLWWLAQFVSGSIVFINHSKVESSEGAHIIRGVSLFSMSLLACLSLYSHDVPEYKAVVAPNGPTLFRSPLNGPNSPSVSSVNSPLLPPLTSSGSRPVLPRDSSRRFGAHTYLSESTLYGADTSVFRGAISAWDEAVSSSLKQQVMLERISDNEGDDEDVDASGANGVK